MCALARAPCPNVVLPRIRSCRFPIFPPGSPPRRVCLKAAAIVATCTALAFAPPAQARKKSHKEARKTTVVSPAARAAGLPASVLVALQRAKVPASAMSVVVERVGDPEPLIAWNASRPMMPASTMKLVTTFSGLSILGPDYRWRTTAYTDGTIDPDGTLQGNLYIKGTGDPKLVPEELIDLVDKLRRPASSAWPAASCSTRATSRPRRAISLRSTTMRARRTTSAPIRCCTHSRPCRSPSRRATTARWPSTLPPLADLSIDNQLVEGTAVQRGRRGRAPDADGRRRDHDRLVRGRLPLRCGAHTTNLAILDHTTFFARGFLALAAGRRHDRRPVSEGKVPTAARPLAVHHSPVLGSIVYDINKFSNNVMARNLFLTIGAVSGKPPATPEQSSRVIQAFLQKNGIAMPDLVLENGSGLSREEHVSALSLAALLQAANAARSRRRSSIRCRSPASTAR